MEEGTQSFIRDQFNQTKSLFTTFSSVVQLVAGFLGVVLLIGTIAVLRFQTDHNTPSSLKFAVVGNWYPQNEFISRKPVEHLVVDSLKKWCKQEKCKFIISTGNNFKEGVKSTVDEEWKTYTALYQDEAFSNTSFYSVLGDKDWIQNPEAQIEYTKFESSPKWTMRSHYWKETLTEEIDGIMNTIDLFFLDTTPLLMEYRTKEANINRELLEKQNTTDQLAWLDKSLKESKATWKIVIGHHPIHAGSMGTGTSKEMKNKIGSILEQGGAQIYISGHDLNLQSLEDNSKISYFVSGAGGSVAQCGVHHFMTFCGQKPGFLAVEIYNNVISVNAMSYEGRLLWEVAKRIEDMYDGEK